MRRDDEIASKISTTGDMSESKQKYRIDIFLSPASRRCAIARWKKSINKRDKIHLRRAILKALENEDTLLRTHRYRPKCFPVCPRAQHLLRTQICVWDTKMFLILFRNILCPQQMFPSLRSPRNIMGNNVSSFARALRDFHIC